MRVHPVADLFPMMSEEELADLASDIKANGLIHPIIKDKVNGEDVLIDGRNRLRACEIAGIKPRFEGLNGHEPVAFILSSNVARRQMTKGQIAITIGRVHRLESNRRSQREVASEFGISKAALAQAEVVLQFAPELADQVLAKTESFDSAYAKARTRKAEAETNDEKMARLRAEAPDLADLAGMSLDEAIMRLDQRKAEAAKLALIEDEPGASDLVARVRNAHLSIDEAIAIYEKRTEEKRNAQSGATALLARIMALIDISDRSPKQVAAQLMENVNPKMWPQDQADDFTSARLKACGDMLIECARILKAGEK